MMQVPGAHQRILIAEDETMIALEEEDLVRGLGYEVAGPVGYLDDALRLVAAGAIDGAVLDVHLMGNSTFFSVAAELDHRGIPFVFVTGLDTGGVAALFPQARVVRKPFDPEALRAAITDMMASRRDSIH